MGVLITHREEGTLWLKEALYARSFPTGQCHILLATPALPICMSTFKLILYATSQFKALIHEQGLIGCMMSRRSSVSCMLVI